MKKRSLGNTGLELSILGMGCWQYGGGSYWGPQDQRDVDNVVHEALDTGINYFDTAEVYNEGESEISLGHALKGKREQAIIGSKVSPSHAAPATLRQHCEDSLRRLQTDYIDLYMLHWPITPLSIKHFSNDASLFFNPPSVHDAFATLEALKQEGKIRHYAISNHGVKQIKEIQEAGFTVAANELAYNLLSRAIEEEILPYCVDNHIGVIGYMPLMQGLLSGKYAQLNEVKPMQARSRHFHHSMGTGSRHGEEGAVQEVEQAISEIRQLADSLNVHTNELALAWSVHNDRIASTIVGSRNSEQLSLNVRSVELQLNDEVIQQLNRITKPVLHKLGNNPDYYESRHNSRIH